jgi:hypothetical protein
MLVNPHRLTYAHEWRTKHRTLHNIRDGRTLVSETHLKRCRQWQPSLGLGIEATDPGLGRALQFWASCVKAQFVVRQRSAILSMSDSPPTKSAPASRASALVAPRR